jgi:protein ImuA
LTLAVALAAAAGAGGGPLLWVLERGGGHEAGRPYAPGLAALGIDPADVIVVAVSSAVEALAAAEMGLEAPGLAGVVVDLPARLPRDMLRLGKRLSLRTQAQAVPCLLVHAGAAPVEMPVASRWLVASRPPPLDTAGGPDLTTAFDLTLTKNRAGRLTRLAVGWQPSSVVGSCGVSHAFRFVSLGRPHGPALSAPVAAEAGDRPAAPCGTVVCFAGGDGGARVAGRAA